MNLTVAGNSMMADAGRPAGGPQYPGIIYLTE